MSVTDKNTKQEIQDHLTNMNIEFPAAATKDQLLELVPPVDTEVEEAPAAPADEQEIEVSDPEVLKPKELPLVVKTPKDGWSNAAQAQYAAILNGYAYRNPEKFKAKKNALIERLKTLATNPGQLAVYLGTLGQAGKLTYKNQLTQGAEKEA